MQRTGLNKRGVYLQYGDPVTASDGSDAAATQASEGHYELNPQLDAMQQHFFEPQAHGVAGGNFSGQVHGRTPSGHLGTPLGVPVGSQLAPSLSSQHSSPLPSGNVHAAMGVSGMPANPMAAKAMFNSQIPSSYYTSTPGIATNSGGSSAVAGQAHHQMSPQQLNQIQGSPGSQMTSISQQPVPVGSAMPHYSPSNVSLPRQSVYSTASPMRYAASPMNPMSMMPQRISPLKYPLSFESRFTLSSGAWSQTAWGNFLALTSFNEEADNCVHIIRATGKSGGLDDHLTSFTPVADAMVSLPQTKVMWDPSGPQQNSLKLLSTGDCVRIWNLNVSNGGLEALCPLAKKSKTSTGPAAPLTSFDWNAIDNNLAITSSIDTTCTLWDLQYQTVRTQLIAHDSDVYDVAFLSQTPHQFVSSGADGSARLFDLRSLDNSTIIYETQPSTPLLRVAPNPHDPNILACIGHQQSGISVVDIRSPRNPLSVLEAHQAPVNSISWAPPHVGRAVLASAADDCQVLVWDLTRADSLPLVGSWTDTEQINNVIWSPNGIYIGSIRGHRLQGLRFA